MTHVQLLRARIESRRGSSLRPWESAGRWTIVGPEIDELPGFCWCGRLAAAVPYSDVRSGFTISCGARECGPAISPRKVNLDRHNQRRDDRIARDYTLRAAS